MRAVIVTAGLLLTACVTPPPASERSSRVDAPNSCNEEGGETYLSQPVTAELGAQILTATEARSLRWVPPGTSGTMEHVKGRVSVFYDRDMRITRITCG
jgi:hypothetical protein